jgi:hypothetical protein
VSLYLGSFLDFDFLSPRQRDACSVGDEEYILQRRHENNVRMFVSPFNVRFYFQLPQEPCRLQFPG